MDKFAVLQLKKKRAREAEAKAKGHIMGDVLNAEKQKLSREDLEKMSRNFGYMDPPTACYAIGKDAQAAVWWAWTNPLPPYYPEPLSDDEEEKEKDKDSDDDEDEEHKEAPPVEEAKVEEEPAEEEDDEPEFDEEGNVIIKGPTKAQLEAKRLRKEAKAAAKAERERVRAEKLLDGSAKVKIKCDGCGKRFKIGTKSCNKCFRALKQPDLEEIARIEAEAKAEAEAKLAEVARLAQEKAEFRKQRREAQREEMNKRVKGFVINRYRKDPFRGDSSSARGDALAGRSASPPRSSKGGPSPAFGAKHASHNDESAAAGISMYSSDSPVIPHYSEDDAEADEMGVWRKKGTFFFEFGQDSKDKMQIILDELPNNYEYRFTVSVMNGFGTGIESAPSNVVMIETPLPAGWNRFFSDEKKAFYYANLKLNLALWRRPDLDPYFLEESILQLFNNAEVTYLKGLYDEEMMHFQWIIVDRFIDVLSEVGEKMSKYRIIKLFDGYASNNYKFKEWRFFMDIFFHIKKRKMQGSLMGQVAAAANIGAMVKRQAVASILGESEGKMGDWIIEYSNIADREFYRNKKTKVTSWDMPDEIRFFLPGKLEAKLLRVFDYGHIETFKQYYSMLDVDNSGDLSDLEIKRLLNALGVQITPDGLAKLVETVDLNGNGTIEFDEFCWMMYEMSRTDGEGELSGLQGKIPSMAPPMDSVPEGNEAGGVGEQAVEDGERPQTASLLLDMQQLSLNLASETGHGLVDQMSKEVLSVSDAVSHTSGSVAIANSHSNESGGGGIGSARSTGSQGKNTQRSQSKAPEVEVHADGSIIPVRPDSSVATLHMYAADTNAFDGPAAGATDVVDGDDNVDDKSEEGSHAGVHLRAKPMVTQNGDGDDASSVGSHPVSVASSAAASSRKKKPRPGAGKSPAKVGVALGTARSDLTADTGTDDELDRLIGGEEKQGKVVKMDLKKQASTALAGSYFGDTQYDLSDNEGISEAECPVCGLASDFYKCKQCYEVGYCSRACCVQDIPSHRMACKVKSKEEIEALKAANAANEEREAKEAQELKERLEREKEEAMYDAMLEEYEDEGGVLIGPDEELDPISNAPRKKKLNFKARLSKRMKAYWYPKQTAEVIKRNAKIQGRIDVRRAKRKAEEDAIRDRDLNSVHGPYCFCGCRAY